MNNYSINEELNKLFDKWHEEIYPDEKIFIRDGIINEVIWESTPKKILFIAKEANNRSDVSWDFREWWGDSFNYTFSHRVAEWAYGILENFTDYDTIDSYVKKLETLQKIAFMNINKTGGVGTASNQELKNHIDKSKSYILKQIEIINPEIIISCIGDDLNDYLFSEKNWSKSGFAIWVKKYENAKLISFLHPSARSFASAPYCLLKSVFESQPFKNL
ncbi:MAG: hypothetical protein QM535_13870 [Limnohabitans sp.]|nr:hypothetical protein [Limnohabitans sp.]